MKTRLLETILRILNFDKAQLAEMEKEKTLSTQHRISLNENIAHMQKHIGELEAIFEAVKSGEVADHQVIDEMWLGFNEELKLCQDLSGKLNLSGKAKLFD